MIDTGLLGTVAVVTGANHGIGAATARALAAQGAHVFATYWRLPPPPADADLSQPGPALYQARQAQDASAVVTPILAAGGRAEAWEADLSDPARIPELFDRVEAVFGPVEVLVNNATFCVPTTFRPDGDVPTLTAELHDAHFSINSRAVALLTTEFARRHVARQASWGRIVNLSTDASALHPDNVAYAASKHAIESWSRSAAVELASYGITVNVVAPGPTQTGYITEEVERREVPRIPLGRLGQPEDIADVIVFLASHQARWLTGQILYAGGGKVMSR